MPNDPELLSLARAVLEKNRPVLWDTAWDTHGTPHENLSQRATSIGTAKSAPDHDDKPTVPLSHALGDGTSGLISNNGTAHGTVVGQHFGKVLAALRSRCPELIEASRWQQAIQDAATFLAKWGDQAHALGWTARDLFGLHQSPARPRANYSRLSRYDATGLIWLLQGRVVVALTATEAAIQGATAVLVYRKHNKPALGPLGDSLDDMGKGA